MEEKDWSARFRASEKRPPSWRSALITAGAGIVITLLSLIRGGPCGPGTLGRNDCVSDRWDYRHGRNLFVFGLRSGRASAQISAKVACTAVAAVGRN